MGDRLTVRLAYQRGWQVVEKNHAIETFDSEVEAFKFVHGRGARVRLMWARTVIAGQIAHFDFDASFQNTSVGRIMRYQHGPPQGTWFWTCYDGGARGTVATRDEALAHVETAYTRRVVGADLPR